VFWGFLGAALFVGSALLGGFFFLAFPCNFLQLLTSCGLLALSINLLIQKKILKMSDFNQLL
jgi:hypothetical protein